MSDVSNILKPGELNFTVIPDLAEEIDELIAAIERDDWEIDMYYEHVLSLARRTLTDRQYMWLSWYYVCGGWREENGRAIQPD